MGKKSKDDVKKEKFDFGKFLHDSEKGTYCGTRDCTGWKKILGFYFCYYSFLACFWALMFYVMTESLREPHEGPLINRFSPEADVSGYATIRTGWPASFPDEVDFTFGDADSYADEIEDINKLFARQNETTAYETYFQNYCGGAKYGYDNDGTSEFCVFVKINRVFYFPNKEHPIYCFYELEKGSTKVATNSTLQGFHNTGALSTSAFPAATFLNQPGYNDPIFAIKVDPSVATADNTDSGDFDDIRFECVVSDVDETSNIFRVTAKKP